MAGGKSKTVSDAALALDTGAARYLALLTTLPTTNTGTGLVEVTAANGYARILINSADWGAVSTAADNLTEQVSIAVEKDFAQATAAWGTVVGWALYDAATLGTLRRWGPLVDGTGAATSQAINTGTTFGFKANTVTTTEA